MTTNKTVGCSNAPQETATDCGYVGLQAIMLTVGLFANKYITLNHEWNITGNYAVRMHKTLKHYCVHYNIISFMTYKVNTIWLLSFARFYRKVIFHDVVKMALSLIFDQKINHLLSIYYNWFVLLTTTQQKINDSRFIPDSLNNFSPGTSLY